MTFMQWYGTGFTLLWFAIFIKQIFYWRKGGFGHVGIMFGALEDALEWISVTIASFVVAVLGPINVIFVPWAICNVLAERKRLQLLTDLYRKLDEERK